MSSSTSAIFSGASRYTADFQQLMERAIKIGTLPVTQLQKGAQRIQDQANAVGTLQTSWNSLYTAVKSIESAISGTNSLSIGNASIVSAQLSTGAMAGTYSIQVTSLGAQTSMISQSSLTDVTNPDSASISTASSFTLTVNGDAVTVTPESNTLRSLADAINNADAGVTATIVNMGSTGSPDYRLSLRGTALAADTIQLNDGSSDLLDVVSTGSNATYKLNGIDQTISSDSTTITLAPGITATMLAVSAEGQFTNITVSKNFTSLQTALTSFATAYNDVATAIAAHRGDGGGALKGQGIISSLSGILRSVGVYSDGTTEIPGLTSLGLELDKDGRMSFLSSRFTALDTADVQSFLGSATSGFLKTAKSAMVQAGAPGAFETGQENTGVLGIAEETFASQTSRQDKLIARALDRVNSLRDTLARRLSTADAAIAAMEQKVLFMTNLFQASRQNQNNN